MSLRYVKVLGNSTSRNCWSGVLHVWRSVKLYLYPTPHMELKQTKFLWNNNIFLDHRCPQTKWKAVNGIEAQIRFEQKQVLNGIICFSVRFCDNLPLVSKMRFQVFSFASKKVQGFSSDRKILKSLLSVLFHLQNFVSVFWILNF